MKALVLIDHGSRRAAANEQLDAVAERVRARGGLHVEAAHMELASPSLADALAGCVAAGATDVIVVPYFLGPGRHVTEDIPRLASEAAAHHPGVRVRIAPPLGVHDLLADLVLARADEV